MNKEQALEVALALARAGFRVIQIRVRLGPLYIVEYEAGGGETGRINSRAELESLLMLDRLSQEVNRELQERLRATESAEDQ